MRKTWKEAERMLQGLRVGRKQCDEAKKVPVALEGYGDIYLFGTPKCDNTRGKLNML